MAYETNSWVFLAAQHPHAIGEFIHFTSPRLLRDAKSDMEELVNDLNATFTGLMNARRKNALDMGRALAKAQQVASTAKAEASAMRRELEAHHAELAVKEAELAQYRMRLGL